MKYHFASDNAAGVAPEAWAALEAANHGYELAYGEDSWTDKASNLIRDLFETDCEVFFTFNGTAANSLALSSMCQSYHSIICHEQAHIALDNIAKPLDMGVPPPRMFFPLEIVGMLSTVRS